MNSNSINPQDERFCAAMEEIGTGNFVQARTILASLSEHPHAQLHLAALYRDGQGGPIEIEKARSIFNKLADSGDANAMYLLARLFLSEDRLREAAQYFEYAAKQDHPSAAYWAAALHEGHAGHPIDEVKHDYFLRKAADLGHLFAKRDLALNEMRKENSSIGWVRCFLRCQYAKLCGIFMALRNPDDLRIR